MPGFSSAGDRTFDPLPVILSQILRIVHAKFHAGETLAQFLLHVDRP